MKTELFGFQTGRHIGFPQAATDLSRLLCSRSWVCQAMIRRVPSRTPTCGSGCGNLGLQLLRPLGQLNHMHTSFQYAADALFALNLAPNRCRGLAILIPPKAVSQVRLI